MTNKNPRWKLDDTWAVDTDPFNVILYKRRYKKDGAAGGWGPAGYYPSFDQLLESLLRKISRTEDTNLPLIQHVEHCYERVTGLSARLSELIHIQAWKGLQRPSTHSKNLARK